MKTPKNYSTLIGAIIGFLISSLVNTLTVNMDALTFNQRLILVFVIVAIILFLLYLNNILNERYDLADRLKYCKLADKGEYNYTLIGKMIQIGKVPYYIHNIGNYFNNREVEKLLKYKFISPHYKDYLIEIKALNN